MPPNFATRWAAALVVAVLGLMVTIGWLDVVRGRELTMIRQNQVWVMQELARVRDALERHDERERSQRR